MTMRTASEWLTPVKASGMAAYLVAAAACAAAAVRAADKRIVRLAAVLCVLDAMLLLDIAFDWRWKLYDWLRSEAVSFRWYDQRSGPQIIALVAIGVAVLAAATSLGRKFAFARGAQLAICGGLLSIGCWLTEVVSLHASDAVLYHRTGPLMMVSFVWIGAGAITTAGILIAGAKATPNL